MSCKSLTLIMIDSPKLRPNHISDDVIVSFLCLSLSKFCDQDSKNQIFCNSCQKIQETLQISNTSDKLKQQQINLDENQVLHKNVFQSKDMNSLQSSLKSQKTVLLKEISKNISSAESLFQIKKKNSGNNTERQLKKPKISRIMMFLQKKLTQKSKKKQDLFNRQMN